MFRTRGLIFRKTVVTSSGMALKMSTHIVHMETPLLENPKDEVFERYAKCPVGGPLFSQGPCSGTWRGSFAGTFERKEKCTRVPFFGTGGH
jgi:hypothetical protein